MDIQVKSYEYSKVESTSASISKSSTSPTGDSKVQINSSKTEQAVYKEQSLYIEDSLEIGSASPKAEVTYKFDAKKIAEMKNEMSLKSDSFKAMVRDMLEKQGLNVDAILARMDKGEAVQVKVDDETKAKAQENISEDGFWGVKATSKRILDFAKAISNNDPSKINMLKDAFKSSYEEVKELFGGKLPEISQKTYDAVMKGFDDWENGDSDTTENAESEAL